MNRLVACLLVAACALVTASTAAADDERGALALRVVSSPAHLVSGGDARVEIEVPASVALSAATVTLNGADVTSAFVADPEGNHQLEGVITGLPLGKSTLVARTPGPGKSSRRESLTLTNHDIQGPMFSGPRQVPFLCASQNDAFRFRLLDPPAPIPQSETCATATVVSFRYRSTSNQWLPYNPAAPPDPATIQQTTTMDGMTAPLIIRWERGVINRFMYSIAMLSPAAQNVATPDFSAWNRKLLYSFSGGVAIGRYQGTASEGDMLHLAGLGMGYAVIYSSGTRTNTHYNLQLGGETAIMVKDRFVSVYAEPEYTIGVGGSGGAIQQYVYGQNHNGLLDGGVPQYSYSDMVTQTIHVGDCELLERWADSKVIANPLSMWQTWVNRSLIEGLGSSATHVAMLSNNPPIRWTEVMPWMPAAGSTECIAGWRGLSPLALNPHFGTAPGYNPAVHGPVEWTHWGDLVNIYGTDETGFARSPWDNVGVQYGLAALREGKITGEQFLDLNANVGSWKEPKDMIQEGCPFVGGAACFAPGATFDIWSSRNMNLSPDGGATPAARREGDRTAQHAAYRSGMVFRGKLDIPVIDWRHYLEHRLDMHHTHQSFATRQRLLNYDGDASNQIIWFTDARPGTPQFDQTPQAFLVLDQWLANIKANPEQSVAENKPADAVDSCFATNGSLLAKGDGVWNGILDDGPNGACTDVFPLNSSPRIVSGGPIEGSVFACQRQSVSRALRHGVYGSWEPTDAEVERLEAIFPTGVCDYSKPDAGMPRELRRNHRGEGDDD